MNKREELLARLMNFLAEKFKNQLVLKGGMLLRLLNRPREAGDLDYAWIRTKKRNLFAQEIKSALETLDGIQVPGVQANSRGIFIEVADKSSDQTARIEISVAESFSRPPQPMTTASLSQPYSLKPQVVATMDLAEALSNKIAASIERNQIRDLYDLMLMEPLTPFDEATLRLRLSKIEIGRSKPKQITPREATEILTQRMQSLTGERIQELTALIPDQSLQGMELIIKASLSRIIQKIEILGES